METTHAPLHLRQMKSGAIKSHGDTQLQVLFESLFGLTKLLNMVMGQTFNVMLG
jgi:hypothetical protein